MSIEIKIIDPSKTPTADLRAVIAFLQHVVGDTTMVSGAPVRMDIAPLPTAPIAPEDSPAAGVDASEIFATGGNPAEVFAGGANPAEVFAGNAPAAPLPDLIQSVSVSVPAQNTNLVPVQNIELDKRGLPWDARIHAETKSQIKAGTWKNKRGVDDATIAAVEAELRAVLAVASPNPPLVAPVPPAPPGPTTPIAPISAAPSVPVPPNPPLVGTLAPPPPVASGVTASTQAAPSIAITFPQLCARITGGLGNGTLTQDTLAAVLGKYQLQGLPTLASFPNLVGPVAADLGFV